MAFFQDLTLTELAAALVPLGNPDRGTVQVEKQALLRAKQIYAWVYKRYVLDYDLMSDLAKPVREFLKVNLPIYQLKTAKSFTSLDGTHKVLWELSDHKTIESVVIPAALAEKKSVNFKGTATERELKDDEWSRLTVCISSQVGCAMACQFCLTGVQGLDRHLQTHEIISQVLLLKKEVPLTNIVFMGMGEPLHNLDNVIKACQILTDPHGLQFSKRKVCVSTSGIVPAIEKLGQTIDVALAVSLNAPNDEKRSKIMPVNKKWNIRELLKACRDYPLKHPRKITFEYVLLKDFNDSLEDAEELSRLLRSLPCKINLIPLNEHSGTGFQRPTDETVRKFQKYLLDRGFIVLVRLSRGQDISAACGQLRSLFGTARGTDRHRDHGQAAIV